EQDDVLQTFQDRRPHLKGGGRIARKNVVSGGREVFSRAPREAQLHWSKRRKAASTSLSVANWRRLACVRLSSTSPKCAGSMGSGSPSLPVRLNMARAISSWLSGGNRRTAASA